MKNISYISVILFLITSPQALCQPSPSNNDITSLKDRLNQVINSHNELTKMYHKLRNDHDEMQKKLTQLEQNLNRFQRNPIILPFDKQWRRGTNFKGICNQMQYRNGDVIDGQDGNLHLVCY